MIFKLCLNTMHTTMITIFLDQLEVWPSTYKVFTPKSDGTIAFRLTARTDTTATQHALQDLHFSIYGSNRLNSDAARPAGFATKFD
jgi:hypothetical protein